MHDIEKDGDAESMGGIDQLLEVLGSAWNDETKQDERRKKVSALAPVEVELFVVLYHGPFHTVTTAGCKKAGDLITKRRVVGVLHNGHQLNSVVSQFLDSRKYIGREFGELPYTSFCCRYAHCCC